MSTGSAIERIIEESDVEERRIDACRQTGKSERVYVASSWRNNLQIAVVHALRAAGMEVYDFKNPPGGTGFKWQQVMHPDLYTPDSNICDADDYIAALQTPIAEAGFNSDMDALRWADTCVLVLDCNKSAHLELGWAVAAGRRTAILLNPDQNNKVVPELMYKMVDHVSPSLFDLLGFLGVED